MTDHVNDDYIYKWLTFDTGFPTMTIFEETLGHPHGNE